MTLSATEEIPEEGNIKCVFTITLLLFRSLHMLLTTTEAQQSGITLALVEPQTDEMRFIEVWYLELT